MKTRFAWVLAAALMIGLAQSSSAGWHHWHRHHRVVSYAYPVWDYAPYRVFPGYSVHGPALYHRSYYSPVGFGAAAPLYRSAFPAYYGSSYSYWRTGFTRYGVYGGSFAYAPLTVGYPYSTGYLSVVRPVQPYVYSSALVATPVVTAYSPCVYGSYGYIGF